MTTSENQNGSTQEELAQRVARLEGAMSFRGSRRPWWICWALVWLAFGAIRSFGWSCGDGRSWRMAWPLGILLVFVVLHFVRDRRDALDFGGKR